MEADKTTKYEEELGLLKIPAEALLKEARMEVGQLKALVDEKDYEIAQLKERIAHLEGEDFSQSEKKAVKLAARKEARKEAIFKDQNTQILALQKKLAEGRKDRDTLLCTISALRNKLERYEKAENQD